MSKANRWLGARRARVAASLSAALVVALTVAMVLLLQTRPVAGSSLPIPAAGGLSPSERLPADLALFRSPPARLPQSVASILASNHLQNEATDAHLLSVGERPTVWAVADGNSVCLVGQENRSSITRLCSSVDKMLHSGLAVTFISAAKDDLGHQIRKIIGIAPDWAKEVVAITGNSEVTVPVKDDVFFAQEESGRPPDSFRIIGSR